MPLYTRPSIIVLGASGEAVSGAADTNENTLATVTIAAGLMGVNGIIRVETLWSFTNSVNNKNLRWRLGGIGGTAYLDATQTTTATYHDLRALRNRNSASSQVGWAATATAGGHGASTSAVTTSSVNTAAATTLVITGQKASAGETLTLEAYTVELIIP
jgi:hypothetical protein